MNLGYAGDCAAASSAYDRWRGVVICRCVLVAAQTLSANGSRVCGSVAGQAEIAQPQAAPTINGLANAETKLRRDDVIGWFGNRQAFLEAHGYMIRHHQIVDLIPEDDDDDDDDQT